MAAKRKTTASKAKIGTKAEEKKTAARKPAKKLRTRKQTATTSAEPEAEPTPKLKTESRRSKLRRKLDPEAARELVGTLSTKTSELLSSIGETFEEAVRKAMRGREHVLMVLVNGETRGRLDELIAAGLFKSRSESAAFLLSEGIAARQDPFDRIEEKLGRINALREELRQIAREE